MKNDINEIRGYVELYFKEHLPKYTVLEIIQKSRHPDDDYLYIVSAKNDDGTFGIWTAWNQLTQSLNHGHYDIESLEECERLVEQYIDHTKYFVVYRYAQKAKERIFVAGNKEQAEEFCADHNWEWKDENDFVWGLDYCEA